MRHVEDIRKHMLILIVSSKAAQFLYGHSIKQWCRAIKTHTAASPSPHEDGDEGNQVMHMTSG